MSWYAQFHGLSVVSALVNKVCLICCTLKGMLYILIRESCKWLVTKKELTRIVIIRQGWAKYRDLSVLSRAEANNWSLRNWQITIFCDNQVQ